VFGVHLHRCHDSDMLCCLILLLLLLLLSGAAVCASGQLVASPGAKQAVELKADKLTLVGGCDAETYPLQKVRLPGGLLLVRLPSFLCYWQCSATHIGW
jgi:hypothetical protein